MTIVTGRSPIAKGMALVRSGRLDRLSLLIDQASTSAGNFLLTLALVRTHSGQEFGAFGLAMFTMVMVSSLYRYAFVVPVSLWSSGHFRRRVRALSTFHLGVQLLLGASLLIAAAVEWLLGSKAFVQEVTIACFGVSFLYMSVDFDRALAVRIKGAWFACVVSTMLAAAMLLLASIVYFEGVPFGGVMIAIGGLGLAKTLFVNACPLALRHARYLSGHLLRTTLWGGAGNLLSAVYNTAPQWFLGLHSPPLQVAGFAAVRTPLQPLMVAVRSFDVVDKAAFARIAQTDHVRRAARARKSVLRYLAIASTVALVVGMNAAGIVSFVIGDRYLPFTSTLILTSIYFIVTATAAPLETVTFANGKQKAYAIAQGVGAIMCILAMFPLIQSFGANGAVLAAFVGWTPPICLLFYNFYVEVQAAKAQRGQQIAATLDDIE